MRGYPHEPAQDQLGDTECLVSGDRRLQPKAWAHTRRAPWAGVSTLDVLTLLNMVVQFMREHIPRQFLASVNEIVTAGGQHPTSIPTHAQAWYVYRSPRLEGVAFVRDMLGRAARAAVEGTGARCRSQIVASTRLWLPNPRDRPSLLR